MGLLNHAGKKDQSPNSLGFQQAGEPLEVGLEHCSTDTFVFMLSIWHGAECCQCWVRGKSPSSLVSGYTDSHELSAEKRMGKKGEKIDSGVFLHRFTRMTDSNLILEKFVGNNERHLLFLKAAQGRVMAA